MLKKLLLQAENISFSFGTRTLFEIKKLEIFEGDHIGLVGLNGSGKSTLLRLLMGELEPDKGTIKVYGTLRYFAQLSDSTHQNADRRELNLFGVQALENRDSVSGGEGTRLRLAELFSESGALYLIDEPTSHLDAQGLQYLSRRLWEVDSFLMVSHDRELLDQHCNTIIEIENGEVKTYSGNYSDYCEQKKQAFQRASFEYEQYTEEMERLQNIYRDKKEKARKAVKKPRNMSSSEAKARELGALGKSIGGKSKSLERSARNIQKRMEHLEIKEKPRETPKVRPIFTLTNPPQNPIIMEAENLSFSYPDGTEIFRNTVFRLPRGSRTVLMGENGAGKTTLIRLILEGEKIRVVPKARIGYLQQDLTNLRLKDTVLESTLENSVQPMHIVRTTLARLLFTANDMNKPVSVLSGGERIRLAFARIFVSDANVLVLDEPTNYLDIPSVEAIQELLSEYEGTMLLVSHDHTFVKAIANRALVIRAKQIFECDPDVL